MSTMMNESSGPLFDGRMESDIQRYCDNLEQNLAQEAVNRIHFHLGEVIRVNHGIYEAAIHTERVASDIVVTDLPIVYGPWLEGVGSRNFPVTRFRGYHTFRIVADQLDRDAEAIAEEELQPYLREMNA